MRRVLLSAVLTASLAACGAENREPPPEVTVDAGLDGADAGEVDAGYQDPGIPPPDPSIVYPAAPYGTAAGDTIKDIRLYGYPDPTDPNTSWRPIALSDFYDPNGNRGPNGTALKAMLVNVSSVWCSVCKAEAPDLERTCAANKAKGLVCYTAILEDASYNPATRSDVNWWAERYSITHPIVLDSTYKWTDHFDRAATPMNMVIDLANMHILYKDVGYDPDTIQATLACRLDGNCAR